MLKFAMLMGLLVGSLFGLAVVAALPAALPPMRATPSLAKFSTGRNTVNPTGPFSTYLAAHTVTLDLENLGFTVSFPYQLDDGWWIDVAS